MSTLAMLMLLSVGTLCPFTAHAFDANQNQRLVRKIVSASGEIADMSKPEDDEMVGSKALSLLDEVQEIVRSGASPESGKIKVIKDIVTGELLPDLVSTHKSAVNQIGINIEAIKACNANMLSTSNNIASTTEASVGQKRSAHAQCREAEKEKNSTKTSACRELDAWLDTINSPVSMPDPKQRDAMVAYVKQMSEYWCPKGPKATDLDAKCTAATKAHSSHKSDCDIKQATFEGGFCVWRTQLTDMCSAHNQCYESALPVFNEHVAATKTLVVKWKAEWAALKKIVCYTDVWLKDKNDKTVDSEQLKVCESSTIDTKPMDIDFPSAPPKATCSLAAVQNYPGSSGFIDAEYAKFKDYAVDVIPCLGFKHGTRLLTKPLHGKATESSQSTTYRGHTNADKAVDGNLRTMAHTAGGTGETNPWWQLDLGKQVEIGAIRLLNRPDKCASRLFTGHGCAWEYSTSKFAGDNQGADIYVGDSGCTGDKCAGKLCGKLIEPRSSGGHWYSINCKGAVGRYVSLMLPGKNRMLNFMEIEIYEAKDSPLTGTASESSTSQSSVYEGTDTGHKGVNAEAPLDGDPNTMAHTTGGTGETNPWWQLDIGSQAEIGVIRLLNRPGICASRLFTGHGCAWEYSTSKFAGDNQGASIYVGDSGCTGDKCSGKICDRIVQPKASGDHWYSIDCKGAAGRYVSLMLPGKNRMLNFMEIEIYQAKATPGR